jgi:hypothetical protein
MKVRDLIARLSALRSAAPGRIGQELVATLEPLGRGMSLSGSATTFLDRCCSAGAWKCRCR